MDDGDAFKDRGGINQGKPGGLILQQVLVSRVSYLSLNSCYNDIKECGRKNRAFFLHCVHITYTYVA